MARVRLRRPPWWLLIGTAAAVAAVVALLAWPSSSPLRTTSLRVAEVPAAVRALESRLGGAQRYTEIKATAEGVSLFVVDTATAGTAGPAGEVAWFYRAGDLRGPAPPQTAGDFPSFPLDGVDLDAAPAVARRALEMFVTAELQEFTLVRRADHGVVWALAMRSSRGGRIDLLFGPSGEVRDVALR